jgi:hypothetical protein
LCGVEAKAALEQQKPLNGVASIGDFVVLMKVEGDGRFEDDGLDEWGLPLLIASYSSKSSRGSRFSRSGATSTMVATISGSGSSCQTRGKTKS